MKCQSVKKIVVKIDNKATWNFNKKAPSSLKRKVTSNLKDLNLPDGLALFWSWNRTNKV